MEFYQRKNGDVPALEFVYSLNPKLQAKVFSEIELLKKHGPNLREPFVKPINGTKNKGIFELRIKFSTDISRIFYFVHCDNVYVLLNGFVKKTGKTPEREIERARRYKIDYEMRVFHE